MLMFQLLQTGIPAAAQKSGRMHDKRRYKWCKRMLI